MKVRKDQTLEGEITRIVEEAVFVNVGTAREVVIPKIEIDQVKGNPSIDLEIGEKVHVNIYHAPQNGGNPLGSIARAIKTPSSPSQARDTKSDPWAVIEEKYQVGDVVEGTVMKIKKYGVFVKLSNGIEGLVHISELEPGYTSSPWDVVNSGDSVRVRIIGIDPRRKRISLSMKNVS